MKKTEEEKKALEEAQKRALETGEASLPIEPQKKLYEPTASLPQKRTMNRGERKGYLNPLFDKGYGFKPEYDGLTCLWVIYVVDMHIPSKSGFLMQQAEALWRRPRFTAHLSEAWKKRCTGEEILDFIASHRETMNPRLFLVPMSYKEIEHYQKFADPLPYDESQVKKRLRNAEIKFY